MRIVGGEWRGRPIDSPKGRDVSRPTTDRVREAIASMLESALPEVSRALACSMHLPVRVRSALRCFLAVQSMPSFSISIGRPLLL